MPASFVGHPDFNRGIQSNLCMLLTISSFSLASMLGSFYQHFLFPANFFFFFTGVSHPKKITGKKKKGERDEGAWGRGDLVVLTRTIVRMTIL